MSKPQTLDRLGKLRKPLYRSVRLSTDPEVEEKFRETKRQLDIANAKLDRLPTNTKFQEGQKKAKKKLADTEQEMAANSIKFTFRSMGYKSYDELVSTHTMSKERAAQLVKDGKLSEDNVEDAVWDPVSFPAALLEACFEETDGISSEEFIAWLEDAEHCTNTEMAQLFATALEVNTASRVVVLGNG